VGRPRSDATRFDSGYANDAARSVRAGGSQNNSGWNLPRRRLGVRFPRNFERGAWRRPLPLAISVATRIFERILFSWVAGFRSLSGSTAAASSSSSARDVGRHSACRSMAAVLAFPRDLFVAAGGAVPSLLFIPTVSGSGGWVRGATSYMPYDQQRSVSRSFLPSTATCTRWRFRRQRDTFLSSVSVARLPTGPSAHGLDAPVPIDQRPGDAE